MSNEISVASPRTSGAGFDFDDFDARTVKKVSRRVWIWKVPGVSKVGRMEKDSSGVMASESAENMPILSHDRYLIWATRWLAIACERGSGYMVGEGGGDKQNLLPMMPLEPIILRPNNLIRHPHLPHIMRFRRRRVAVHNIVEGQSENLARGIAG